ncbi:MAG: peptidylprolyl isomerase [bacterium]
MKICRTAAFMSFLCPLLFSSCNSPSSPTVAKVGDLRITQADFQKKLADVAPEYQNYLVTPNGKKQFLDILIREKLILAAAKESPVAASSEYKAETGRMKEEMDSRLRDFKDYLLTKMWIDELRKEGAMKVGEEEIKEYYAKHPHEISIEHILVANAADAEKLMRKIKAGAGFAAVAKANSLDADTASGGGKVPPFLYGEFLPELEEAAFKMRTGEVQGVVKSKFGYHVLRKSGERTVRLNENMERYRRLLEKKKLDGYLQNLQSRHKVEVLDDQYR